MNTRTVLHLGAPVHGAVVAIEVAAGEAVAAGRSLVVQEAMKMEVPLAAPRAGTVRALRCAVGDVVEAGVPLVDFEPEPDPEPGAGAPPSGEGRPAASAASGTAAPSPGLQVLHAALAATRDAARPQVFAALAARGRRSARENLADLLDAGSFVEYGALAVAAQRGRRSLEDLQAHTPADGLVTGLGRVAGRPVAVMAYDYTVLAGTQGAWNHAKTDRLLGVAAERSLPLVLFAEGGGGRPGDVDWPVVAGLDCTSFRAFAALSGRVPLLGVVAGWCFAGNAALLGCCDVVVAVDGASIGLGGPAMIEGGGLGRVAPGDVGPVDALAAAGAVDLRVADEAAAVAAVKRLLGLFRGAGAGARDEAAAEAVAVAPGPELQGTIADASTGRPRPGGDLAALRHALPPGRHRAFDPRTIVETVMDAGSLIELRRDFGASLVTALARLDGRPVALAASVPAHLGGALDAPSCDKLARFLQLADAHGLPFISFVDTPGFMVGPASERTAMVRHAARLFVGAAALRVPVASVVLRRGYGLGAMALTAGHFHAPVGTCAWPSAEFGAMGLEGAVRLGYRRELEAAPEAEREALFQRLLAQALERGDALNTARHLEIDAVIDPADTRDWLCAVLQAACAAPLSPRRPFVDAW